MRNDNVPEVAEEGSDRYNVPRLEPGSRILCEFSRDNRTLSAPELARRFDLPRSTVFRLLSKLESLGFIEHADAGRDSRQGMSVLRLGFEYLASLEITELGLPILRRMSDEIRYPCNLVVRDGRSIVYVAKVSPPAPFASSVNVGTRLPAHATVLGRILLEDLTLPKLRALYPEGKLESFSSSTPRTVTELFDLVQGDRSRGYAISEGFFESSIPTIAAPVRDQSGQVVAALGATVNSGHFDADRIEDLVVLVRAGAEELSGLLDYSPSRKVVSLQGDGEDGMSAGDSRSRHGRDFGGARRAVESRAPGA